VRSNAACAVSPEGTIAPPPPGDGLVEGPPKPSWAAVFSTPPPDGMQPLMGIAKKIATAAKENFEDAILLYFTTNSSQTFPKLPHNSEKPRYLLSGFF
jgi:hypothetical protein